MKARDAWIAWNGLNDRPFAGTLIVSRVAQIGEDVASANHTQLNGATRDLRFSMHASHGLIGLFQDFQYLVVEERLDPEVVHRAFLAIDEYAEIFGNPIPQD